MEDSKRKEEKNSVGSFIRWQFISINQFSYVVNLLIVLSVSTVGFSVSLLFKNEFLPVDRSKFLFTGALFTQLFSLVFGFWCNIYRLNNFRLTMDIARKRELGAESHDLACLRQKTEKLGKEIWLIFWWQFVMFCVGILMLTFALMIICRNKLF